MTTLFSDVCILTRFKYFFFFSEVCFCHVVLFSDEGSYTKNLDSINSDLSIFCEKSSFFLTICLFKTDYQH